MCSEPLHHGSHPAQRGVVPMGISQWVPTSEIRAADDRTNSISIHTEQVAACLQNHRCRLHRMRKGRVCATRFHLARAVVRQGRSSLAVAWAIMPVRKFGYSDGHDCPSYVAPLFTPNAIPPPSLGSRSYSSSAPHISRHLQPIFDC